VAGLAFAFAGDIPARLHFAWPRSAPLRGVLRGARYCWVPVSVPIIPRRCGGRFTAPLVPFPGFLAAARVRAGTASGSGRDADTCAELPASAWREAPSAVVTPHIPWGGAGCATVVPVLSVQNSRLKAFQARAQWRGASSGAQDWRGIWALPPTSGPSVGLVWRDHRRLAVDGMLPFVRAWRRTHEATGVWRRADEVGVGVIHFWRRAPEHGESVRVPWGGAGVRGGISWPWPRPASWPEPLRRPALRFHFHAPVRRPLTFHFGREPAWWTPIQRSYRMQYQFSLVRLPDRAPIPVRAVALSCAWDEWGWSLSATLAGPEAVDELRPVVDQAIEVEMQLDGYVWQFRLDRVAGSSSFGQTDGQTQGVGRAALLGPGAALPANGYEDQAKTARQLAEQELIGTTWQLDWPDTVPDWLVPARRLIYSQKTPMEVIIALVETAGGRVLADPVAAWLHVAPRYPLPAWEWGAAEPDILLPRDLMQTLSWTPRLGQPWDAVYLGDGATVLAMVKRAGLPGASLPDAPIIDPLLCDPGVCRTRRRGWILRWRCRCRHRTAPARCGPSANWRGSRRAEKPGPG